jgi:hypothetical protein
MKRLKSKTILLTLAIGFTAAGFVSGKGITTPHSNAALATLEAADQADRTSGANKINWDVVDKHDAERRTQVLKLLSIGAIRTSEDFLDAAIIFQHGDSVKDAQLAFSFATTAVALGPSTQDAKPIMAQAWDRIMRRSGKPQWYGTQYVRSKTTGKWALYQTDPSAVTDNMRQKMGLPTLAEARANANRFNK